LKLKLIRKPAQTIIQMDGGKMVTWEKLGDIVEVSDPLGTRLQHSAPGAFEVVTAVTKAEKVEEAPAVEKKAARKYSNKSAQSEPEVR